MINQVTTGTPPVDAVEIHHMLVVSTGHISEYDAMVLDRLAETPDPSVEFIVRPYEYGWTVIYTGSPALSYLIGNQMRLAKLYQIRLADIVHIAVNDYGCTWIQFDQDGPIYPEWQTLHW